MDRHACAAPCTAQPGDAAGATCDWAGSSSAAASRLVPARPPNVSSAATSPAPDEAPGSLAAAQGSAESACALASAVAWPSSSSTCAPASQIAPTAAPCRPGSASLDSLPSEVVQLIFFHLGFPYRHEDASNAPPCEDGFSLYGSRLARTDKRVGAMGLALTCRRFLAVFSKNIRKITLTNRHRFGLGSDEETASLIAIAAGNLDNLCIEDMKHVGARTVTALNRHCPNVSVLSLTSVPGVCSPDLARFVATCGCGLKSLTLASMYVGDDVLNAIAQYCYQLEELHLIDLDSDVSASALGPALMQVARSLRHLRISSLFGSGLNWRVVFPSADCSAPSYPALKSLELACLGWLSGPDAFALCKHLAISHTNLDYLRISPRPTQGADFFSVDQMQQLRQFFPCFGMVSGMDGRRPPKYGFGTSSSLRP